MRQVRALPYIRFSQRGEPPIYAQGGQFFAEEQDHPIPAVEVPPWVLERLTLLTPQGRAKIGMASEEDKKKMKKVRRNGRISATTIDPDETEEGEDE